LKELDLLKNVKVLLPLGQIAFTQTLKSLRLRGIEIPSLKFGHGKIFPLRTPNSVGNADLPARPAGGRSLRALITTYHPSQQNTQTGRLTKAMFHKIFRMAIKKLEVGG
jgi:uracil-DNA glycosylase